MTTRRDLIKEVNSLIREAKKRWDAHENAACRRMRDRALNLYETLTKEERNEVPEQLRIWLRYRSEKYFGHKRTAPGTKAGTAKKQPRKEKKKDHAPDHAISHLKIQSTLGPLYLLASKKGLCGVYFGHRIEPTTLPKEDPRNKFLQLATSELEEYFARQREKFTVPLDAKGTAFRRDVWRQLSQIPYGTTMGYGELAENLGNPKAVRAVGTANGANPISIIVPCHRVIGKNGELVGFGGGLEIKRKLLQHEGILLGT